MTTIIRGSKSKPNNPISLSDEFLSRIVGDKPNGNLTDLGQVVFYSKYSRYRDDVKRREYYSETAQRATEYNVNLAIAHLEEKGLLTEELLVNHMIELQRLFQHQFETKMSLSGRTLWIGGTEPSYVNPMSNFNCSFMVMNQWGKLGELIHLGMVGSGIGFRILQSDVKQVKPIIAKDDWDILHAEYKPKLPWMRKEHSKMEIRDRGRVVIIEIGDSKEGWRQAIDLFFDVLTTNTNLEVLTFNYNSVRPAGEELKRFGGRAGGHETIKSMFDTFHKILTGKLDTDYPKLVDGLPEPIHMLDLANAIGKNIVSGDVRSIAEIALLDPLDKDTIEAKSGIFTKEHLNHRFVSNNSVYYLNKPDREQLEWQFDQIKFNGEPCFVNAEFGRKRRKNFNGVNPCVEILLDDRGLCNLTTVNMMAFVQNGKLDIDGLLEAFRMATRAGLRMTLPKLELEEWDIIQQRDRLLGVSFTGYQDMIDAVEFNKWQEEKLLSLMSDVVHQTAEEYSKQLGVNMPLLSTCVKPEGTISQMFGGVSSGLHVAHAPNFIRRIRSATKDPITKAIFEHNGWTISAEIADGSQHNQIREIMQYLPNVVYTESVNGEDSIRPSKWEYKLGTLSVEFSIRAKEEYTGDWESAIVNTISTFYDNDGFVVVNKDGDFYNIRFEVATDSYDVVFGKSKKAVTEFPNVSPAKRTKANFSAIEQLEVYKMVLNNYTDHNPSNTISVREEEWDAVVDWIDENWDNTLAVSFLSLYDTPYPLSPFEEVGEDKIKEMQAEMQPFDVKLLWKHDLGGDMEVVESSCEGGHCPVR